MFVKQDQKESKINNQEAVLSLFSSNRNADYIFESIIKIFYKNTFNIFFTGVLHIGHEELI